jgi:hypothetical protein
MCQSYLPVPILENIASRTLENPKSAACESRGMFADPVSTATSFDTEHFNFFIRKKRMEQPY